MWYIYHTRNLYLQKLRTEKITKLYISYNFYLIFICHLDLSITRNTGVNFFPEGFFLESYFNYLVSSQSHIPKTYQRKYYDYVNWTNPTHTEAFYSCFNGKDNYS